MNNETDHTFTREQMAAALTGGLSADEQSRFDAHLAACPTCAADYAEMKAREADLADLFADAKPVSGFEDRMIRALRETSSPRRNWVHPLVRRAATGVAAAILLGSAGYVITAASTGGTLPDAQLLSKKIADVPNELYGLLRAQDTTPEVFGMPLSNAQRDNGGTTAATQPFSQVAQNLRYSYQDPYPGTSAEGGGFKLNNAISAEFAVGNDINPGTSAAAGESLSRKAKSGKETDAKHRMFADGHAYFDRSAIPALRENESETSGAKAKDADGDEQTSLGMQVNGWAKQESEWRLGRPAVSSTIVPFKPTEMKAGEQGRAGTDIEQERVADSGSRERTIENLQQNAKRLVNETRYAEALGIVDQIKVLDPTNNYAEGVRPLIEEKAKGQEQRRYRETIAGQKSAEDKPVYDDVLRSPTNWPELSQSRPQVAKNENAAGTPGTSGAPAATRPAAQQGGVPVVSSRKVIRTGFMEFEVDRFDSALAMITKLTQESDGYVGTTDSEKLPNGKVKGTVVVRVPPERLDALVMQLRGIGDLRSQKMDAQDVTKQYTDLEGELRAARAMEERLLEIIKTGKGEIKDLLAAEKELSVWRGKIEKIVGEMKYYDNLVSLTTLTVTLFERDIRTAALAKETETVNAGVETEDVEAARAAALKAIEEAKGRVIQSDLKRHDAGQFSAMVVADVSPDQAGALVDRIKQLGKVARFEVQRKQTTPDGTTQPAPGARLERAETRINLSLYNLANVEPRQTTSFDLAAADVEAAYKAIAARVAKAGGRVVASNLARPQADQVVGKIQFQVKAADGDAVMTDVRALGEVLHLTVNENADTNNVTSAKQGFVVQVLPIAQIPVRESTNVQIAAADVPAAYNTLRDLVRGSAAVVRVSTAQLNEAQRENVSGILDFEIMRGELPAIEEAIRKLGDVTQRTSGRSGDTENTIDSKVRVQVAFVDADQIPPRETTSLGIETSDPDKALADVQSVAQSLGARVLQANLSQERGGQTMGKLVVDVPLAKSVELITRAKAQGAVRMVQSTKDAQAAEGSLARARVDLTYMTSAAIVAPDQGIWASIRRGLATSMTGLMLSLQLIIVGVCFIGPWVLVIALIWKFLRRRQRGPSAAPVTA